MEIWKFGKIISMDQIQCGGEGHDETLFFLSFSLPDPLHRIQIPTEILLKMKLFWQKPAIP